MTIILCAVSLFSAYLQSEAVLDAGDSPRSLYERAADLMLAKRYDRAQQVLEQLLKEHSNSPIAGMAVVPLCELYLKNETPERALHLLDLWKTRLADSQTIEQLAPHTRVKCKQLTLRGLLANQNAEELIASLREFANELERFPKDAAVLELKARTAIALAREYERQFDFAAAEEQLRRICEMLSTDAESGRSSDTSAVQNSTGLSAGVDLDAVRRDLTFRLPLAEARHQLEAGNAERCAAILKGIDLDDLAIVDQVPVRFLLMEALLQANRSEAAAQLEWLNDFVANQAAPPSWAPTLILRQGEELLRNKKHAAARKLLDAARDDFPEFQRHYEFSFLLARCAIANVDFEAAGQYLHAAMLSGSQDREAVVRARWLLGELNFLQRRHEAAIGWYEQVLPETELPQWRTRACLQMAKCQELTGQRELAIANYEQVQMQSDTQLAQQARDRLAVLQAASPATALSPHAN